MKELIDRLLNFKSPKEFPINDGVSATEIYEDVVYLTEYWTCLAFYKNGKVLRLNYYEYTSDFHWNLYKELFNLSKNNSDFRIEEPVKKETIHYRENNFSLIEVQRPGNDFGIGFFDDMKNVHFDEEYWIQYVEQVSIAMKHIEQVCKKFNHFAAPFEFLAPQKRFRDEKGYFWVDCNNWLLVADRFKQKKMGMLFYWLMVLNSEENPYDFHKIMNLADKKWKFFND